MGRFRTAQNNLQNDPASKDAYANAMDALPTAKADTARTCCDALTAAMNAYEARINGPKYTVNFQGHPGGGQCVECGYYDDGRLRQCHDGAGKCPRSNG